MAYGPRRRSSARPATRRASRQPARASYRPAARRRAPARRVQRSGGGGQTIKLVIQTQEQAAALAQPSDQVAKLLGRAKF